ncbi:MAG: MFS transporter [Chloroflexi bacterium]|nr:MFS transporter [Chloroflexota bacterium]
MAAPAPGTRPAGGSRAAREPLWSPPFLLICGSQFLSYANNVMLHPVLPLYLASLGQTPAFVGLTVAAFSVTSFAPRPLVGQGVDRWSARGVYVLGALALAASSFSYLLPLVALLLLMRTVHGLGWAAVNTAGVTIVSETTPASRRGEGVGYFGMTRGIATGLLPALGVWLVAGTGFPLIFVLSGLFGLGAACTAAMVPTAPRARQAESGGGFWSNLVEPRVALPATLRVLLNTTHPITTAFVALYARERGIQIEDFSFYYLASGFAMVGAQSLAGFSDRWGRAPLIAVGFTASTLGLASMLWASALLPLVLGGALWSAGVGLLEPALLALAIDKAPPSHRGASMATYTASFQVGTTIGGLVWGVAIEQVGYSGMFLGAIAVLLAGLVLLAANWESAGGRGLSQGKT